ncbi:MAG: proton-conducting transporter membrane subunit, partial [Erysipelotrichaceae bacterium]|nr:proton-conducting transporter membrane subunit [Erysipelotrichaceae bacterium]
STFMAFFVITLALIIMIFSTKDIDHEIDEGSISQYYTLVLILLFSMVGMVYTNDLFNMYVFMEILSLTSCAIISIKRKKENYLAALRYLVLNTIGSLSVLFGIALLYMVSGHLNMTMMSESISLIWQLYPTNILIASGFMLTGFAIKAAVFPLHIWLPDAHSNAPTPSSALLSSLVVKIYVFAVYKLLFDVLGRDIVVALGIPTVITVFAAAGMLFGSIFAMGQKDIKRMLAYSSVAQIGYIFLGLSLMTEAGLAAGLFHVVSHGLMKTALFLSAGSIIYYRNKRDIRDLDGIGIEMPVTMVVFAIAALGMIGIPGTNGFMSKLYLSFAVLGAGQPLLLAVILLSSYLNAVYYLPIVISAFLKEPKSKNTTMQVEVLPLPMLFSLVTIGFLCLLTGFYPTLVMNFITQAVNIFLS